MNRAQLFEIAGKHKDKPKHEAKKAIRAELIAYFNSPEGQEELRKAPRVTVEFEPNFPLQDQPVERIVDMIMQELD